MNIGHPEADVHLSSAWFLEAAGVGVWSKAVTDVLLSSLVDQCEGDLLLEGPLQEDIKWTSHYHKEH